MSYHYIDLEQVIFQSRREKQWFICEKIRKEESEIGGARPRIEMLGGDFLSRPRPCMGCSAWQ
jgi:hypothetical protein